MTFSLNEVEATAKRATRGAGYCWGLSEDAAKATRWLCRHGLDGPAVLARVLAHGFAQAPEDHTPHHQEAVWQGAAELCPIATGVAVSDRAAALNTGPIVLQRVAMPLMLVPFAALAARQLTRTVTLECDMCLAVTDGNLLELTGQMPDSAQHASLRIGGTMTKPISLATRGDPDPAFWDMLNCFAHKTYAPATEESRRLGAGAGLSDND